MNLGLMNAVVNRMCRLVENFSLCLGKRQYRALYGETIDLLLLILKIKRGRFAYNEKNNSY